MAKYGSGLSLQHICDLELQEASEIMQKYGLPREARKRIADMIEEAYHEVMQANEHAATLEKCLMDMGVDYKRFIAWKKEKSGIEM